MCIHITGLAHVYNIQYTCTFGCSLCSDQISQCVLHTVLLLALMMYVTQYLDLATSRPNVSFRVPFTATLVEMQSWERQY